MKTILLLIALLLARPANAVGLTAMGRPFHFHVPPNPTMGGPRPLIILLHGYGSNGQQAEIYFQLKAEADRWGILLAYPDGTRDPTGQQYWNGAGCCAVFTAPAPPIEDVAYVDAIIDTVSSAIGGLSPGTSVDTRRIFLIGHSNGSFLAHRYACERARVAAIVTLSGAQWNACPIIPPSRVSVLHVHATSDGVVPYYGRSVLGVETVKSAVRTVQSWFIRNGCSGDGFEFSFLHEVPPPFDLEVNEPGDETTILRPVAGSCPADGDVEHWRMNTNTDGSAGHVPTMQPGLFARMTVLWLMNHPKLP